MAIKAKDVRAEGERATAAFRDWVQAGAGGASHWRLEEENYEGWRVRVAEGGGQEGWLLLRPSLHDPGVGGPASCFSLLVLLLTAWLWWGWSGRLPVAGGHLRGGSVGGAPRPPLLRQHLQVPHPAIVRLLLHTGSGLPCGGIQYAAMLCYHAPVVTMVTGAAAAALPSPVDLVINVESEQAGGMRAMLQHLLEFFRAQHDFDVCKAKVGAVRWCRVAGVGASSWLGLGHAPWGASRAGAGD